MFLLEILLDNSAMAVLDFCLFFIKLFINVLAHLRIWLWLVEYFDFL